MGGGEDSKEVEFQKNRNRREKETIYRTVQEIPPNPKEPWDREMDYDDSLTPVISIEQLPDADVVPEMQVPSNENARAGLSSTSQNSNPAAAEPDLELLAVLLKNPEIVFALTSGGAGNLSTTDTVRLLDMIKAGGGAANLVAGNLNGLGVGAGMGGRIEGRVEVSLPSPTPSSNPPVTVRNLGFYCTMTLGLSLPLDFCCSRYPIGPVGLMLLKTTRTTKRNQRNEFIFFFLYWAPSFEFVKMNAWIEKTGVPPWDLSCGALFHVGLRDHPPTVMTEEITPSLTVSLKRMGPTSPMYKKTEP